MRKLPAAAQEERRRQVIGLRQAGLTYDAIAAQVGLTRTGVFTICRRFAERGQALSQRMNCGVCHLPDYRGREQIPRLAGQREDYLLGALREYRDNKRVGTDTSMNAVVYAVPNADLAALAHYLAHVP